MTDNFLIWAVGLLVLGISFAVGYLIGLSEGLAFVDNEEENNNEAYCFECEIEMPVKVKNGNLYCSNCGLHH